MCQMFVVEIKVSLWSDEYTVQILPEWLYDAYSPEAYRNVLAIPSSCVDTNEYYTPDA